VKAGRRWLVNAIRGQLLPEFVQRGFVSVPFVHRGETDRESIVAFPFSGPDWFTLICDSALSVSVGLPAFDERTADYVDSGRD
jgi:hypothetical protein